MICFNYSNISIIRQFFTTKRQPLFVGIANMALVFRYCLKNAVKASNLQKPLIFVKNDKYTLFVGPIPDIV